MDIFDSAVCTKGDIASVFEYEEAVRWDSDEQRVGLFVFGALAAFDATTGANMVANMARISTPRLPGPEQCR